MNVENTSDVIRLVWRAYAEVDDVEPYFQRYVFGEGRIALALSKPESDIHGVQIEILDEPVAPGTKEGLNGRGRIRLTFPTREQAEAVYQALSAREDWTVGASSPEAS